MEAYSQVSVHRLTASVTWGKQPDEKFGDIGRRGDLGIVLRQMCSMFRQAFFAWLCPAFLSSIDTVPPPSHPHFAAPLLSAPLNPHFSWVASCQVQSLPPLFLPSPT